MVEIIGWIAVLAIAVKLLEMGGNNSLRNEKGEPNTAAMVGVYLGWIVLVVLAALLAMQGIEARKAARDSLATLDHSQSRADCIAAAQTVEQIAAC